MPRVHNKQLTGGSLWGLALALLIPVMGLADEGRVRITDNTDASAIPGAIQLTSYTDCAAPACGPGAACAANAACGCRAGCQCGAMCGAECGCQNGSCGPQGCVDGACLDSGCYDCGTVRIYSLGDVVHKLHGTGHWMHRCRESRLGQWWHCESIRHLARNKHTSDCLQSAISPQGCCGKGCALVGRYNMVYAVDPNHADPRDGQLYSAQGYGVPVTVPLAPNVRHSYNYGWGIPSSRLTPISHPAAPVVTVP